MKYFFIISLILSVWLLVGGWMIGAKNQAVFYLNQFILWPQQWLKGLARPALTYQEKNRLILANNVLRAELFQLKQQSETAPADFLEAKIHARRPFNDKNILSVNVGASDGVRLGMAATVGGFLLLGRVEEAFDDYSLVKTIFTPEWQIPVRVGPTAADGLLIGSASPSITMIAKDKDIKKGDVVFSAGKDFAYGLKIGEILSVREGSSAGVFKEARLALPYGINDLTEIWLIKQ